MERRMQHIRYVLMTLISSLAVINTQLVRDVEALNNTKPLLYVFGDSYADTGNHDPISEDSTITTPWRPPYGISWPGYPSGRFSNGRVFTDFFASHLRVKTLPYHYVTSKNITKNEFNKGIGVNFAFGGSGLFPTFGPSYPTIATQIDQLKNLINMSTTNRAIQDGAVAFLVIAGNDYVVYQAYHPQNQTTNDIISKVVKEMGNSLKELYTVGFRRFVVTKIEPFGCLPPYRILINNQTQCNKTMNSWASLHNELLIRELDNLQHKQKHVDFKVLDFESAFLQILEGNSKYKKLRLEPCCKGINGANCGDKDINGRPLFELCSYPEKHFFWDGSHPSQMGWKLVSKLLFKS